MIGGGRRRMRHHQAVPCSMVVAVERWSGRHRRRRGGRCFCSAASSAEKRGEFGGRPPTPPLPLRSAPCGELLRKEIVRLGPFVHARPCCRAERMGREGCGGIEIRGRKHARDTAVLGWSRAG